MKRRNTGTRYAIKSEVFTDVNARRPRVMDGPWRLTIEDAIEKYCDMVARKSGYDGYPHIVRIFAAESCDEKDAASSDGKVFYKGIEVEDLQDKIKAHGVVLHISD
jgi:hypothetical protein